MCMYVNKKPMCTKIIYIYIYLNITYIYIFHIYICGRLWQGPFGIMWTTCLFTPAMSICMGYNVVSRHNCHFFVRSSCLPCKLLRGLRQPMSDTSMLAMARQAIFSQERFPAPPSAIQAIQQPRLNGSMMAGTPQPPFRLAFEIFSGPKDAPLPRPKANTLT